MDNILTLVVFSSQVYIALSQQVIDTSLLSLPDSVEDWRLPVIINSIRVSSHLYKHLHDLRVALPSCVKYRCLTIRIDMVSFATTLQEQFAKVKPAIS